MAVKTVICFCLFCLWLQVESQQGPVLSSAGDQCFGQTVTLTCIHPDPFQDSDMYQSESIAWAEDGVRLNFGDPATLERFTRTRLSSTASTLSFTVSEDYHANRVISCSCYLLLSAGGRNESTPIIMDVNAKPPTIMSTPDDTSGLLQWNSPSSNCSNYQYMFTLTWDRMEDNITDTDSTKKNSYDFAGMPGGNYTVSLKAKVINFILNESKPVIEEFSLTTPPSTTSGSLIDDPTGIYIGVAVGTILVVIIVISVIIGVICYCQSRKMKVSQSSHTDPVPALQEYSEAPFKKREAEDAELGQTRQELDKKQEAENDQIQYAAIDFSGQRPIAPPSLETVVYTETVEQFRKARKNRPIPPLPPAKTEEEEEKEKQLAQEAAEITADFKAQVVAILQASKLVYRSLDPEEPVVGTYQKKTFVANFVHAPGGKEILSSEVEAIIKARELQSTDKGFLMATADSISGPWLEHLEKHNCHFIGLSRKGGVKKEMLLKKLSFCFPESSSF